MSRALRLALLLLAAVALCAPAARAATPVPAETILTGGLVSNEGSGQESVDVDNKDVRFHETATVGFNGSWLAPDLYWKAGESLKVISQGGGEGAAESMSASLSGKSTTQGFESRPEPGHWGKILTCKFGGQVFAPNGIQRPENRNLTVPGAPGFDSTTGPGCDDGSQAKPGPVGLPEIMSDSTVKLPLGTIAPKKTTLTRGYQFSHTQKCDSTTGMPGCIHGWSGGGTLTLKCALCVQSMTFEQYDYPSGNLVPIGKGGITDGNHVVVTASVYNASRFDVLAMPAFKERTTDRTIIDPETMPTHFKAHQTTKVVLDWDTSGFAWEGTAEHSDRELVVDTGLGAGMVKVKVLPRPIVLVHGWKAEAGGWDLAKSIIPGAIHTELKGRVFAVGDGQYIGKMNTDRSKGFTIDRNAGQLAQYVEHLRQDLDAQHVDLIVHSMGGLISRSYINDLMPMARDGGPAVRSLLMLGTPNMGSPCAVLIGSTGAGSSITTNELAPDWVVNWFNKRVINRKGVRFAIVAGDFASWTCSSPHRGDGVVEIPSAVWQIADASTRPYDHVSMTDHEEVYRTWAKPRLAADPDTYWTQGGQLAARSSARDAEAGSDAPVTAAGGGDVDVPAGGSAEVPVSVRDGDALIAAIDAPSSVRTELVSPSGVVADTQDAGSVAATQPIRVQRALSPAAGTWKLRLTATGAAAHATVGFGLPGSKLVLTASGDSGALTARLTDGGTAVRGATVTGTVRSDDDAAAPVAVTFADDGAHGDGAAGDGVYGASSGTLPSGMWFASVRADASGQVRSAMTSAAGGAQPTTPGDGGGGNPPAGGGDDDGNGDTPVDVGTPQPGTPAPVTPSATAGATPVAGANTGAGKPAASAQAAGKPTLTLVAKAARDRRAPYVYGLSGTLAGCRAKTRVAVTVKRGSSVAGRATATLGASCRFAVKVKVRGRGKLVAVATAGPVRSAPLALRAG